jgi:hypothetical protein
MPVVRRTSGRRRAKVGHKTMCRSIVLEEATMRRVKQASKKKRVTKAAVPALGIAGLTFSVAGSALAAAVPTVDVQQGQSVAPGMMITLGEEEISDVSLATFRLLDEDEAALSGVLLARGCGGCRGCGGARGCGCRGCAGCRACRACSCGVGCGGCGGCGGGGCSGCGGDAFWFGNFSTACCGSWGRCRLC